MSRSGLVLVAVVIVACLPARTIETRFEAFPDVEALRIVVHDKTGLIVAVQPAPPDLVREGVSNVPGRPDVLLVKWVGGMCDKKTDLTFEREALRYRFVEQTDRASGCLLAGIFRTLQIQLSAGVPAAAVDLVSVP